MNRNHRIPPLGGPTLLALLLLAAPQASAVEPVKLGPLTLVLDGTLHATALYGSDTREVSTSTPHDLTAALGYLAPIGDLTFGLGVSVDVDYDSEAEQSDRLTLSDPDPAIYLQGDRFGKLAYSLTSTASGENCVEAPSAGENFWSTDYVTNGTCPSFDSRSVLYYQTPALSGGVALAVSYMPDWGEEVDDGDAEEDVSIAMVYAATGANGAEWSASLGYERVLSIKGEGSPSDSYQAGINRTKDIWTVGASAALTDFDDSGQDSAIGLGVLCQLTERWQASLDANWSRSTADGADLTETSLSAIAAYAILQDRFLVDFGLWQLNARDAGAQSDKILAGVGLTLIF